MPHRTLLAPLLLASALLAQAPPDVAAKIVAEERDDPQVMAFLDHLTNKIGPRLLVAAINKKGEEKKVTVERDGKKLDVVVRYPDPAAKAADAPASQPSEPKKPKGKE